MKMTASLFLLAFLALSCVPNKATLQKWRLDSYRPEIHTGIFIKQFYPVQGKNQFKIVFQEENLFKIRHSNFISDSLIGCKRGTYKFKENNSGLTMTCHDTEKYFAVENFDVKQLVIYKKGSRPFPAVTAYSFKKIAEDNKK